MREPRLRFKTKIAVKKSDRKTFQQILPSYLGSSHPKIILLNLTWGESEDSSLAH